VIALAGTYGVWLVGFLPSAALSPAMGVLAAAMTLGGSVLIVFTVLHLGRSFSIVPQARALVTQGPYAIVRHPLYAAEEVALIGVAMHVVWYAAIPFLIFHVALQLRRMAYEERLLRNVFPQYDAYARRTARWIPGIW
jgi:protein-S-isoprenylcysteine O-methyltransferase Ste14